MLLVCIRTNIYVNLKSHGEAYLMKYLTKEWYELCQRTCLHLGMKVTKGASVYNEELYNRLYKKKENGLVRLQRKCYDSDPRVIIKDDKFMVGSVWLYQELYRTVHGYEAHMLFAGDELSELIIHCKDIVIEKE